MLGLIRTVSPEDSVNVVYAGLLCVRVITSGDAPLSIF
jgi:hypothetical protein